MNINAGDILQSPRWNDPIEVIQISSMGDDRFRLIGKKVASGELIDQILTQQDLEALSSSQLGGDFSAPARDVFLGLEALRYRFASMFDPLLAMNVSKVDPLPHQIEAVYGYVLNLPRIRFLIADDPGAGKTIMAGLILKELKLRGLAHRILIIVPGHLKDQWRREMKERFEEHFFVVDRQSMDACYGENIWNRENQIITSIDFAKRDDVLPSLDAVTFDLVIVDEAHKMSAYRYGNKLEKTNRYQLGEVLSRNAVHMLFLTATPHKGDPENFRLFLDLLEPGFFATDDLLQNSISERDNPLLIRRMKEDLKDFEGRPLFLPRHVETISFDLGTESPAEKELYNELSRYVETQFNKALQSDKRRNVAFALVILQRRLASSTYALLRSLERRKGRLQELLRMADPELRKQAEKSIAFDLEEAEDAAEEERWELERTWETLSVAENRQELEKEIATIEGLLNQAKAIIEKGDELKLRRFQEALEQLQKDFPGEKILVFTESKDTMEYLTHRLGEWGYQVCNIHGGMRLEDRIAAEGIFKNQAQVLVATEAAGEGINLQFCHLLINYDLPWNPNRLEQRMGRIHRYGQTKEVYIFNLVAGDTREGRVLTRVFEKLEQIRQAIGSDKVFDVLGEIYYDKNLAQLLLEAAANARSLEEILREIDIRVDEEYIQRVKNSLGESLATRYIDYTRMKEMAEQAREHRLVPEYTEGFFMKAWAAAGGRITRRADGFLTVDQMPFAIKQIAEEDDFRRQYGQLLPSYERVTFDKDVATRVANAEFVSFGHPLFEAVLRWVERHAQDDLLKGAVFIDPDGRLDGTVLFYIGEIIDGLNNPAGRRLFAFYVDRHTNEVHPFNPAGLWDLQEGSPVPGDFAPSLDHLKSSVLIHAAHALGGYEKELLQQRQRQADIKRKYGVRSLEHLIVELDGQLIRLEERRSKGENVDLVMRNKKEQKQRYESALKELEETIQREVQLNKNTPRFVGAVRVMPAPAPSQDMQENPELERIGMELAMQYERAQGREPEDVSAENLGFDIRSLERHTGRRRYIEVKTRAGIGDVLLTRNEWFKAQRFGQDYYLYVVLNAATSPSLHIIQDPAHRLQPAQEVEVRFRLHSQDILRQAQESNPDAHHHAHGRGL